MRFSLTFILGLALFLAVSVAAHADAPPAGQVTISKVAYHGTGCRDGSVASNLSPDGLAMTLIFGDYGVDTSSRQGRPMRRACELDVALSVPSGWQYTVFGVDVRGYASLEAGTVGVQKVFHSFGHAPAQQIGRIRLVGAFDDDYQTHSDLPLAAVEWSPCNSAHAQAFHLRTAVTVRPQNGFGDDDGDADGGGGGGSFPVGMMTVDSIDGQLAHDYSLAWRRCGAPAPSQPATATCSLAMRPHRTVHRSATADSRPEAKLAALTKLMTICQVAAGAQAGSLCQPEHATCDFGN